MKMDSGLLPLLVVAAAVGLTVLAFIRVSIRLRRGGGSLTTTMLGATDGFLDHDKSKAAETIVDRNAGITREPATTPVGSKPEKGAP